MEGHMKFDVALTGDACSISADHLLKHYRRDLLQEDLCFALWRPSTGKVRRTALVDAIILPRDDERLLHGNASFQPEYFGRAIRISLERKLGLAFMHSHPGPGWQGMSQADVKAERDILAYPARATGLPLVGMTIGSDGYWSARFWEWNDGQMERRWCEKVRVVEPNLYRVHFNDNLVRAPERREVLRRTFDTWGREAQNTISRLRIGIVGLGSVGCFVAESMARIGIERVTLFDPDRVEEHNLDRLLYGTVDDIGQLKVDVAKREMKRSATADSIQIDAWPNSVHESEAYFAALDCDILFSCVDRPMPRDVLNYIAHAHLIPVIDGGIAVETDRRTDSLFSAHWRAHIVTPFHQCLRCNGQYSSSDVVMELDGSLDDPSYVSRLPSDERFRNQNVFPFSQSVAAMEVNLMLRYLLAADWWPILRQQDYHFMTGTTKVTNEKCLDHCTFRHRRALGDLERPFYLYEAATTRRRRLVNEVWTRLFRFVGRIFRKF